jgi:hypothetical protein
VLSIAEINTWNRINAATTQITGGDPGDERPRISRINEQSPESANFRAEEPVTQSRLFAGVSGPFERRDRTTENRGVPGSSPGLAIRNPAFQRDFLLFGSH